MKKEICLLVLAIALLALASCMSSPKSGESVSNINNALQDSVEAILEKRLVEYGAMDGVAFIYDCIGSPIKAYSSWTLYAMKRAGDVCVAGNAIKPTTNSSQTFTVSMLLPNNAMQLRKKKKMRCYFRLYYPKTKSYVPGSVYVDFKAKVKKGMVMTSPY